MSAVVFRCSQCRHEFTHCANRCPNCKAIASLRVAPGGSGTQSGYRAASEPLSSAGNMPMKVKCGIELIDNLLKGGVPKGAALICKGKPGGGKSTIIRQISAGMGEITGKQVLYQSGEEAAFQVKAQIERLGLNPNRINFAYTCDLAIIEPELMELRPCCFVLDSLQKLIDSRDDTPLTPSGQLRAFKKLLLVLHRTQVPGLFISRMNKRGEVQGSIDYEFEPDIVWELQQPFGRDHPKRVLEQEKNRFAGTGKLALKMTGTGLVCEGEEQEA
jgi:DNA repair protein RadA/Sms